MISEAQQEQAALHVLGLLGSEEEQRFSGQVRANAELRGLVRSFQRTLEQIVRELPSSPPPPALKAKVLQRIAVQPEAPIATPLPPAAVSPTGLRFLFDTEASGWKPLPVPGAWIKLLSFQPERGYAVLLGKLEPGVRYPAHTNAGPEDFYVLSGDLQVSGRALGPGDFHHADAGSVHEENYSIHGCTLLAVLTVDDPLVQLALS
jgi:anti-sigma factor ChrR (cupin superfamily)